MTPTTDQLKAIRERCERDALNAFEAGYFDGYMGRISGAIVGRYHHDVLKSAYSAGYGAGAAARATEKPQ